MITAESSKWLSIKFVMIWNRQNPNFHDEDADYESNYSFKLSTAKEKREARVFCWEPWTLRDEEIELFRTELGLASLTAEEITELIGLIADISHETN